MKKTGIINVIIFSGLIGLFIYISAFAFIYLQAEKDTLGTGKADIAIVLGATPYTNGTVNPCLEARVKHAVELYKKGQVTAIIVSGGKEETGEITEAAAMKTIAIENGMDPAYIFEEGKATSTYENIMYSKPALDYYQANSVVIVTEPYHSLRGELVAQKLLQQKVTVSPATESSCWQNVPFTYINFWREPIAFIYYFIRGKM